MLESNLRTMVSYKRKRKARGYTEADEEPLHLSYLARSRDNGAGDHRINTPLTFGENMYSLAYISVVREMYKSSCDKEENQDEINMK